MMTTMTTQPRVVMKKLSPEEIQSLQLSLSRIPPLKHNKDIQVCSALLIYLFTKSTFIYRPSEEILPVPV